MGFVFTGIALEGLVAPVFLGVVTDATAVTVAFVLVGLFYLLAGGVVFAIGHAPAPGEATRPAHGD